MFVVKLFDEISLLLFGFVLIAKYKWFTASNLKNEKWKFQKNRRKKIPVF